jgi:hypothetical protein
MMETVLDEMRGGSPGQAGKERSNQEALFREKVAPPTPEKPIKRKWTARSAELKLKNQPAEVPTKSGWRLVHCQATPFLPYPPRPLKDATPIANSIAVIIYFDGLLCEWVGTAK